MEAENVIYTDGHDVKVTSSKLVIRKTEYNLQGITAFRLLTIKANKTIPILLILLGLAGIVAGLMHLLPADAMQPLNVSGKLISANDLSMIAGGLLLLIGIIWMAAEHDRYAVQITTAEGNKNVIVSTKRDYANQVLSALEAATAPSL